MGLTSRLLEHAAKNGEKAGREWAQNTASFYDLKQISKIDLGHYEDDAGGLSWAICRAVDPDEANRYDDMPEILFGDRAWPTEEWMIAWVRGAKDFFEEVEDQL